MVEADLERIDPKQQNDGRDIEPAHTWQKIADWPQQGLGQGCAGAPDNIHKLIVPIDHIKADQPAHDHRHKDDQDIKPDDLVNKNGDNLHGGAFWSCLRRHDLSGPPCARKMGRPAHRKLAHLKVAHWNSKPARVMSMHKKLGDGDGP